ncbi:MAG TPA: LacI family DNA-binding transcriptional regulator [Actinocrinis sp.]|nr:LacI family DNA-binding transcriptional regulator [Actinocrinis sp.]
MQVRQNRIPTMRDVAREAGVSLMTVSRVVNGEPGVLPETAARVARAIQMVGYQRNDMARHLRRNASGTQTVGLVVDDLANPFFAVLARAVEDQARLRGYLVLIGSSGDDLHREQEVVSAFSSRRVDGMILVPVSGSHRFLQNQIVQGTKVVCVDRPAERLPVDTVVVDNRNGAVRGTAHLLAHGHRRIGYLGDRLEIWTAQERYAGYCDALAAAGLAADPGLVRHGLRTRAAASVAAAELMARPDPPTALFTGNDQCSVGTLAGLGDGYGRVALVGFDDFALSDRLVPAVTVIAQDPSALGATAAQLLFARIDGDTSAPREMVLSTRLVERGSGEIRLGAG